MSPMRPSPSLVDRVISTSSFDPKPLPSRVSLWNDPGICRVTGKGAVECHKRAMLTLSRTMDPDSTRSHPLANSPS